MNATSDPTPIVPNDGWDKVWIYITNIVMSLVVGGTNLFVVFVVLHFKALRQAKEYLVIMSLSLADGCAMMAYLAVGVRRFYLVYKGEHNVLMSPWQCALVSHNLIWSFTDILSGLVLLMVSVDRLLSVAYPMRYLTLSTLYVKSLFGSAYMYSLVTGTVISLMYVYTSDGPERMRSALCFGTVNLFGQKTNYVCYRKYAGVVFSFLSIVAYGLTWILYNQHQSRVAVDEVPVGDNQKKRRLARQRRLTQSLGISCLCTIFMYMIPYGIAVFLVDILSNQIRLWLFIVTQFNPLFIVIIYYYRQPEMKQAFKALFTGKIMPESLSAWQANIQARRNHNKKATGTAQQGDH